jgi:hypothetical protein
MSITAGKSQTRIMKYVSSRAPPSVLILRTLAITWPQGVLNEEDSLAVAAQVYGDVREWQEYQVQ